MSARLMKKIAAFDSIDEKTNGESRRKINDNWCVQYSKRRRLKDFYQYMRSKLRGVFTIETDGCTGRNERVLRLFRNSVTRSLAPVI